MSKSTDKSSVDDRSKTKKALDLFNEVNTVASNSSLLNNLTNFFRSVDPNSVSSIINDFLLPKTHFAYSALMRATEAIEKLNICIQYFPSRPQYYLIRAKLFTSLHKWPEALSDYSICIRLDSSVNTSDIFIGRALCYRKLKRTVEALNDVNVSYKLNKEQNNSIALSRDSFERALVYFDMGNYSSAITDLTSVIDSKSTNNSILVEALYIRGISYRNKFAGVKNITDEYAKQQANNLIQNSISDIRLSINQGYVDPINSFEFHNQLGISLVFSGDLLGAADSFTTGITIIESNGDLKVCCFTCDSVVSICTLYNNRGKAYFLSSENDLAKKDFEMALKLHEEYNDPDEHLYEYYFNLGNCLVEDGEFSSAISQFEHSVRVKETYLAYHNMGLTFLELMKIKAMSTDSSDFIQDEYFQSAIRCFRQSVNLCENFIPSKHHLSILLQLSGEHQRALLLNNEVINQIEQRKLDLQSSTIASSMKAKPQGEAKSMGVSKQSTTTSAFYELNTRTTTDIIDIGYDDKETDFTKQSVLNITASSESPLIASNEIDPKNTVIVNISSISDTISLASISLYEQRLLILDTVDKISSVELLSQMYEMVRSFSSENCENSLDNTISENGEAEVTKQTYSYFDYREFIYLYFLSKILYEISCSDKELPNSVQRLVHSNFMNSNKYLIKTRESLLKNEEEVNLQKKALRQSALIICTRSICIYNEINERILNKTDEDFEYGGINLYKLRGQIHLSLNKEISSIDDYSTAIVLCEKRLKISKNDQQSKQQQQSVFGGNKTPLMTCVLLSEVNYEYLLNLYYMRANSFSQLRQDSSFFVSLKLAEADLLKILKIIADINIPNKFKNIESFTRYRLGQVLWELEEPIRAYEQFVLIWTCLLNMDPIRECNLLNSKQSDGDNHHEVHQRLRLKRIIREETPSLDKIIECISTGFEKERLNMTISQTNKICLSPSIVFSNIINTNDESSFSSDLKIMTISELSYRCGLCLLDAHQDLFKAIDYFTFAILLYSIVTLHDGMIPPHYLHERAKCYLLLNKYEESIDDYSQLLSIQPFNSNALFRRGVCFKHIKQYENSADDFEMAREKNLNNNRIYLVDFKNIDQFIDSIDTLLGRCGQEEAFI